MKICKRIKFKYLYLQGKSESEIFQLMLIVLKNGIIFETNWN